MRFNLKQASLLDASGELSQSARQKLLAHVAQDPAASAEYQAAQENYALLGNLPIPEPSAAERQHIPAIIKHTLHAALRQHEKRAGRVPLLMRYAAGALTLATCVALCATLLGVKHSQTARQWEQIAGINAAIDRVTLLPDSATDQASGVAASPQNENPALSYMHNRASSNLLGSLAVPEELKESMSNDPSAPPGSF